MKVTSPTYGTLALVGASIGLRTCSSEPTPEQRAYREKRDEIPKAANFLNSISISHATESLLPGPSSLIPNVERGNYDSAIRALDQFKQDIEKLQSYSAQIAGLRRVFAETRDAQEKAYPLRNG